MLVELPKHTQNDSPELKYFNNFVSYCLGYIYSEKFSSKVFNKTDGFHKFSFIQRSF